MVVFGNAQVSGHCHVGSRTRDLGFIESASRQQALLVGRQQLVDLLECRVNAFPVGLEVPQVQLTSRGRIHSHVRHGKGAGRVTSSTFIRRHVEFFRRASGAGRPARRCLTAKGRSLPHRSAACPRIKWLIAVGAHEDQAVTASPDAAIVHAARPASRARHADGLRPLSTPSGRRGAGIYRGMGGAWRCVHPTCNTDKRTAVNQGSSRSNRRQAVRRNHRAVTCENGRPKEVGAAGFEPATPRL